MLARSLTVVIVLSLGQSVQGLFCFKCADYNLRSSNTLINTRLKSLRDQACRDDDQKNMKYEECTAEQTKCVKTYMEASVKYLGQTLEGTAVIRECFKVDANSPKDCTTTSDQSELQKTISWPGAVVKSFEGTACVCTGNMCNGQTRVVSAIIPSLIGTALIWILRAWQ